MYFIVHFDSTKCSFELLLLLGLATYNILQNPVYKEAFGITWKFAVDNKDVRSVRLLQVSYIIRYCCYSCFNVIVFVCGGLVTC